MELLTPRRGDDLSTQTCILQCNHEFHSECLQVWLIESSTCPTCRSERITCQHPKGQHDRGVRNAVFTHMKTRLENMKHENMELRDSLLALNLHLVSVHQSLEHHEERWYVLNRLFGLQS